jgi:hypothetical protein
MTDDLDKLMREALRKGSAPPGFAARVLARLPEREAKRESEAATQGARFASRSRFAPAGLQKTWWISGALAASLAIAVALHQLKERATEREGLRARTELMEALRVTSQKLDLAYQAAQEPSKTTQSGGSS